MSQQALHTATVCITDLTGTCHCPVCSFAENLYIQIGYPAFLFLMMASWTGLTHLGYRCESNYSISSWNSSKTGTGVIAVGHRCDSSHVGAGAIAFGYRCDSSHVGCRCDSIGEQVW